MFNGAFVQLESDHANLPPPPSPSLLFNILVTPLITTKQAHRELGGVIDQLSTVSMKSSFLRLFMQVVKPINDKRVHCAMWIYTQIHHY